ncbi:hypothetical protein RI129_000633 [Pyrocoelia pectoralis]|uniref:WAP domain-containing protein n=1 Tax=Pyrocoelia pectoralis TaxID=417401 RepID=A0AAN7VTR3_9COLE
MGQHILFFLCVTSYIVSILGQSKLGDCPKPNSLKMCGYMCFQDAHCRGDTKCCKNACGGFICVPPVAEGVCPSKPTGPWVCTSVCISDNHCPGSRKCCKNRCGAFACTNPTRE